MLAGTGLEHHSLGAGLSINIPLGLGEEQGESGMRSAVSVWCSENSRLPGSVHSGGAPSGSRPCASVPPEEQGDMSGMILPIPASLPLPDTHHLQNRTIYLRSSIDR